VESEKLSYHISSGRRFVHNRNVSCLRFTKPRKKLAFSCAASLSPQMISEREEGYGLIE
jgi:hypothetical protein